MRITVITVDYPPIEGGISTVAVHVARTLCAWGHEVYVIAPWFPGMEESDAKEDATIIRFRGYKSGWLRLFPLLFRAWPFLAQTDLVLAVNIAYGGIIGLLAKKILGKPYVTFAYAYEFLKFNHVPLFRNLLRTAFSQSLVTVAISHFTAQSLKKFGVPEEQIEIILPGASQVQPVSDEEKEAVRYQYVLDGSFPLLLSVGRLIPRKGHLTLIRSLPAILETYPNALLVIVGQGPMLNLIAKAARRIGVREHVVLTGRLDERTIAALYQLCDVFVLPTRKERGGQEEGFGLVFAEAASYGKPVIAGRTGGVPDAVCDGITGILVSPDSPKEVANAVRSLFQEPGYASRLGEQGRKRVEEELNWENFTNRMMESITRHASFK